MIQIIINGQKKTFDSAPTVSEALLFQDPAVEEPFALAVNQQFVPRTQYGQTLLREGDVMDLVTPMQGG